MKAISRKRRMKEVEIERSDEMICQQNGTFR